MNTKQYLIQNWEHELDAFVNCIKAIPSDKSAYTPNPGLHQPINKLK